jgi:hypothetical protein
MFGSLLDHECVLGGVRMAGVRSPWRALRPVLLAGAATLTWLTFSSPAASADTISDTSSLLGGVTSAVSSVTGQLTSPVPPSPSQPAGLLRPAVSSVSELVDSTVASVPVVKHVVPAGAVSAVTVPLASAADGATTEVVHVVAPPVAGALPVLEPVLQPVTDLVTGTRPLPVPLPDQVKDTAPLPDSAEDTVGPGTGVEGSLPGTAVGGSLPGTAPAGSVDVAAEAKGSADAVHHPAAVQGSNQAATGAAALGGTSGLGLPWAPLTGDFPAIGTPGSGNPAQVPAPGPAGPSSGPGSGSSLSGSSGSSGSVAWLHPYHLLYPFPGAVHAGDAVSHAPSPVSFDPGSSPD